MIPLLSNNLYGYCDEKRNILIEPKYEYADLFKQDETLQQNPDKNISRFAGNDYAWAKQDGKLIRIDRKGNVVYNYRKEDFENAEILISVAPPLSNILYEIFKDKETKLLGIRNTKTKTVLIEPKYSGIYKEFYVDGSVKYPLFLASSPGISHYFYVGLNGTEYIIR
ncbi:MAG: WG repeat-containing protein [Niabella sp.]